MTDQPKKNVVILGGGVSGLAAGYFLSRDDRFDVTVLEREPVVGGMCASFQHDGFTLDYGAHKLYSVIPGILDEFKTLMGERLAEVPKKNRIFLKGHPLDYPLRLTNFAAVLGLPTFLKLGMSYAASLLRGLFSKEEPHSYEEYMVSRFGRFAYELVFEPLADKVWGCPSTLHPDMARTRVPASGGLEVILKLLGLKKDTAETNAEFFLYPPAGFGDITDVLKEKIETAGGTVLVNAEPMGVKHAGADVAEVRARVEDQEQSLSCDYLLSSIPLPDLAQLLYPGGRDELDQALAGLGYRHVVIVFVFVRRPNVMEDQWIFFPEKEYVFSRIFEQKQMNAGLGPEDRTVVACDFTCDEGDDLWRASDDLLAEQCIDGLVRAGFIHHAEVESTLVRRFSGFYPRYDVGYKEKLAEVNGHLREIKNLIPTGRLGMYNYNNADHCFDMGRFIAEGLGEGDEPGEIWRALEQRVQNYRIVD